MAPTEQEDPLYVLEQQAQLLSGPLVLLLPPKPAGRSLPPLAQRSSSEAPFGSRHGGWTVNTFIVPAAFPRSFTGSTQRPAAEPEQTGGRVDAAAAYKDLLEAQVAANKRGQISIDDQDELEEQHQLHLAVIRYRPRTKREGGPRGLTLVFAHANGFHKEIWEPTIADLLDQLADPSQPQSLPVDEIWALDAVNQGDSGVLNEAVLGKTYNWADHGRDIINFILCYLDTPSNASSSSSHLPLVPTDPSLLALDTQKQPTGATQSSERTWRDRLIVGIGHSLGGGGMAYASSAVPSVFASVIFCDPVLPWPTLQRSVAGLTKGAIVRKEQWTSKEEAKEGFLKKAFFRQWDPRVLDSYCTFGLKQLKSGQVALKARARDEALTFGDPMAMAARRACTRLEAIPPSLPVHFIFADEGRSVLNEEILGKMLGLVPHATKARVKGAGHLIAQEDPKSTAKEIAEALRRTFPVKLVSKM